MNIPDIRPIDGIKSGFLLTLKKIKSNGLDDFISTIISVQSDQPFKRDLHFPNWSHHNIKMLHYGLFPNKEDAEKWTDWIKYILEK